MKGCTFTSLAEQNLFLAEWERSVADIRSHGTVRQQVSVRFQTEQPARSPLPDALFPSFIEARRKVHRDGHVEFDKAYHSVPPEYLGLEVQVRGEARIVRILNQRQETIAAHARAERGRLGRRLRRSMLTYLRIQQEGATFVLDSERTLVSRTNEPAELVLSCVN